MKKVLACVFKAQPALDPYYVHVDLGLAPNHASMDEVDMQLRIESVDGKERWRVRSGCPDVRRFLRQVVEELTPEHPVAGVAAVRLAELEMGIPTEGR